MTQDPNPFASPQSYVPPIMAERPFATEFPAEMRRVRLGLSLVYFGICGILLTALTMPFVILAISRSSSIETVGMLSMIMGGVMFALMIMIFIGQVLCIAIPQESGAKGLVTASVAMQTLTLLSGLSTLVLSSAAAALVVSGVGNLLSLAATVCFLLFLRKTALYIQREDVARRAVRTLVVGAVCSALLLPAFFFGRLSPTGEPHPAAMVSLAIGALGMLVAFLMYANTITYLRKAIDV